MKRQCLHGGDLSYIARHKYVVQEFKKTHKPIDPLSAQARCVVTGYRLNEISVC